MFEEHSPEPVGELSALTVLSIAAPSFPRPLDDLRARFFEHAALALPKLRYVALASRGRLPRDFSDLAGDRAPWRWWRIIRSAGQDVEFREIPAWEGERVRRYFRAANKESAERFDGKSPTRRQCASMSELISLYRRLQGTPLDARALHHHESSQCPTSAQM